MYPLGISYISPCFDLICKDSTTLPRTLPNLFSSRLKRKGRAKFRPKGTTRLVNRQEFDAFFNVPWARWVRFFNQKLVGIVFEWFFFNDMADTKMPGCNQLVSVSDYKGPALARPTLEVLHVFMFICFVGRCFFLIFLLQKIGGW